MRLIALLSITLSLSAFAAPECLIDAREKDGRLINLVSGGTSGFNPKEPIFVTVSNGGKEYTTQVSRSGKWAVVYANIEDSTSVLCFQGAAGAYNEIKN